MGKTYEDIISLQTLDLALARGRWRKGTRGGNEGRVGMMAEEPGGGQRCSGGLRFSNIIKTYLFCVPHKDPPRPSCSPPFQTRVGDRTGSLHASVSDTSGPAPLGLGLTCGGQVLFWANSGRQWSPAAGNCSSLRPISRFKGQRSTG